MTSAGPQHDRYLPNDRNLPSLKDLNFSYHAPAHQEDLPTRNIWAKNPSPTQSNTRHSPRQRQQQQQQQHTPPTSAVAQKPDELKKPRRPVSQYTSQPELNPAGYAAYTQYVQSRPQHQATQSPANPYPSPSIPHWEQQNQVPQYSNYSSLQVPSNLTQASQSSQHMDNQLFHPNSAQQNSGQQNSGQQNSGQQNSGQQNSGQQIQHSTLQTAFQPQQPQQYQQEQSLQQYQTRQQNTQQVTAINTRPLDSQLSPRESTLSEITKHCHILYEFASRYAQLQATMPDIWPPESELAQMRNHAAQVVRLTEDLGRISVSDWQRNQPTPPSDEPIIQDQRPPKRPWEDMAQDADKSEPTENAYATEAYATEAYPSPNDTNGKSMAEQDMEIIRIKRATTAATTSGVPVTKSKYKKRSRATPPGKCHSCNIRETPEWRRGPDGARTLCNACGLHYAKLQRKRDKIHGAGSLEPHIDMDTLRASARAADIADKSKPEKPSTQKNIPPVEPLQHHQGSFQITTEAQLTLSSGGPPAPPWFSQPQQGYVAANTR